MAAKGPPPSQQLLHINMQHDLEAPSSSRSPSASPCALPLRPGSTPLMQDHSNQRHLYFPLTSRSAATTPDMKELQHQIQSYQQLHHQQQQRQQQAGAHQGLPQNVGSSLDSALGVQVSSPSGLSSSFSGCPPSGSSFTSSTVSVIRGGPGSSQGNPPSGCSVSPSLHDLRSTTASSASAASSASDESNTSDFASPSEVRRNSADGGALTPTPAVLGTFAGNIVPSDLVNCNGILSGLNGNINPGASLSRQQLLSGPCPVCGDRISGFHYGIFSCESCKGFFKRTVQNKKNYVCLRGANCPVTTGTRKKCPACRFDKCLKTGMKLEAIREDRTRGGRSTYQCSYALSPPGFAPGFTPNHSSTNSVGSGSELSQPTDMDCDPTSVSPSGAGFSSDTRNSVSVIAPPLGFAPIKSEPNSSLHFEEESSVNGSRVTASPPRVPILIQEILSVEHLWHKERNERHNNSNNGSAEPVSEEGNSNGTSMSSMATAAAASTALDASSGDFLSNLINIADHRLYKIVKWCKSLPLFKEIPMDDQIALLINSWCELLLLSCCYRSMSTPGEIRISFGRSVTVQEARALGIGSVIERMVNLTEHLGRLKFDQCEYVCLKVIILLTSDASGLKDTDKVDTCQKQVLEALQTYTRTNFPHHPSKFGELLLRIPEVERVCQVAKESLVTKQREGDVFSFNLLMELLRGDH